MEIKKGFLWNQCGIHLNYHAGCDTLNEISPFHQSYFLAATNMMQDESDKSDKQWPKVRMNRKQDATSRMWKKCGMERADFERRLECNPDELITRMYEEADADAPFRRKTPYHCAH